ncbi:hypothetical protein BON30_45215 [Cystobacter ferrugineus]|uniref:Uncharacterized protein n=1 Tax=Cystobacter ferrugineus TaxID=83449 RepID=A0A1L9AVX6_9BACT|nr:hypothetical protein BON30_45215 [Cystobacter ferrugineus]
MLPRTCELARAVHPASMCSRGGEGDGLAAAEVNEVVGGVLARAVQQSAGTIRRKVSKDSFRLQFGEAGERKIRIVDVHVRFGGPLPEGRDVLASFEP